MKNFFLFAKANTYIITKTRNISISYKDWFLFRTEIRELLTCTYMYIYIRILTNVSGLYIILHVRHSYNYYISHFIYPLWRFYILEYYEVIRSSSNTTIRVYKQRYLNQLHHTCLWYKLGTLLELFIHLHAHHACQCVITTSFLVTAGFSMILSDTFCTWNNIDRRLFPYFSKYITRFFEVLFRKQFGSIYIRWF